MDPISLMGILLVGCIAVAGAIGCINHSQRKNEERIQTESDSV
jgi:hypothetical protein